MPWARFTKAADISGSTGVYEIADAEQRTLRLGVATAKDPFGLRGCISDCLKNPYAALYRYEVTTAYLSRHAELLGRYHQEHGTLPPGNQNDQIFALPRFGDCS